MKIFKSLKQGLLYRVFENNNRFFLSVSLNSFFSFSEKLPVIQPEADFWTFAESALGPDMILDAGMPKPRGEVLLTGSFFSRDKQPVQSGQVRFRLGPLTKQLWVCGDRFWKKIGQTTLGISDPLPITSIEISYRNAFGGPDYPRNPLGKGHWDHENISPPLPHPLPNIEMPQSLIRSPNDCPEPSGFGPIDLTWPQRSCKMGTYGDKWLQERFPGLAEDMDWTFFNMAPEDQQIEGGFTGNESFVIENMHPEQPVILSQLPAIKARCFVNQKSEKNEIFKEISTQLDTIWLFPKDQKGLLIYRGIIEVQDSDADDIVHIMIAYESQKGTPRSFEHYKKAFQNRLDKEKGPFFFLNEKDLIPEGERSGFSDLLASDKAATQRSEGTLKRNLMARAEGEKNKAKKLLESLGLTPDTDQSKSPPPTMHFDLENCENFADNIDTLLKEAEKQKIEGQERVKKNLQEVGIDYDKMVTEAKQAGGGRPQYNPHETIEILHQLGIHDPEVEKKLFETKEKIDQAYRMYGHYFPPAKTRTRDERSSLREIVVAEFQKGKSLRGRDFTGADLSLLELKGIDFADAFLEGVDFTGSNLDRANFTGCVLTRSVFSEARCVSANLQNANLGHTRCKNTDFTDSDLTNSVFFKADLDGTIFRKTTLNGTDFSEARIKGADFNHATLQKAKFIESILTETFFCHANCNETLFLNCATFDNIDFSNANLSFVLFVGVKGTAIKFIDADLTNLRSAMETSFVSGDFSGARLSDANLRGVNLSGATFRQADLTRADFSKCNGRQADFSYANAPKAQFVKADLTQSKMIGINLFEGSLQKACLHETDLRGANLYSADFIRANFRNTDLGGANLQKVFLDRWIKDNDR